MHEASYALAIIDAVVKQLKEMGLDNVKVTKVIVRVGELSLVDSVALKNAFEAYSMGSPLEGAELVIKTVPSSFKCKSCGATWSFREVFPQLKENIPVIHLYPHLVAEILKCPKCGSGEVEILQGDEFYVEGFEYVEGESGSN